jgi:hypothetical protein
MRATRDWLTAATALAAVAAASSAELTELPPPAGAGVERGVAILQCTAPSGLLLVSRATLVDVGVDVRAEVSLTTGHGLPSTADEVRRNCRILARGKAHAIEGVWHAGGYAAGPEHDWAVVTSERIKGELRRWRVAEAAEGWLEQLVTDNASVRLVLRYADAAQSDCRLERWTPQRLLAHTCTTYPGTSGSPLVVGVGVEREPVLIGLHVGSQLEWDGKKLDVVSVARPLDAAVIAAIDAAAAAAAVVGPRKRRR